VNLTSLRRVKYALGVSTTAQDHILSGLIATTSKQIAKELRRLDQAGDDAFELKSRVEYPAFSLGQRRFYLRAYPIASVASVYVDSTGRYAGDESLVPADQYIIDADGRSITFTGLSLYPTDTDIRPASKGIRVTYTGGLAADPAVSAWTKGTDSGGSLTIGNYVHGVDSLSVGRITAAAAGTISIECLAGAFLPGETIREYSTWTFSTQDAGPGAPTDVSAVLTACTAESLAEAEPGLVMACESHVRFMRDNKDALQNVTTSNDGATKTSRQDLKTRYGFASEIMEMLELYRNKLRLT
jgi:hypothetical protein